MEILFETTYNTHGIFKLYFLQSFILLDIFYSILYKSHAAGTRRNIIYLTPEERRGIEKREKRKEGKNIPKIQRSVSFFKRSLLYVVYIYIYNKLVEQNFNANNNNRSHFNKLHIFLYGRERSINIGKKNWKV